MKFDCTEFPTFIVLHLEGDQNDQKLMQINRFLALLFYVLLVLIFALFLVLLFFTSVAFI